MAAIEKKRWTVEEYLAFERASTRKHELIDGEVYAMTGASRAHNLIIFNTGRVLGNQLVESVCEAYGSDQRVKIDTRNYVYPDLTVTCDSPEFEDTHIDTLLNPTLIVEVLSPSTERYDRGRKFELYRTLASVQQYILIAQNRAHVECYTRQANNTWVLAEFNGLDETLELPSIRCTLLLADVYRKVSFEPEEADNS